MLLKITDLLNHGWYGHDEKHDVFYKITDWKVVDGVLMFTIIDREELYVCNNDDDETPSIAAFAGMQAHRVKESPMIKGSIFGLTKKCYIERVDEWQKL